MNALTIPQERRLISYLDEKLLNLSRQFETRRNAKANLPTLDLYLESLKEILELVLHIPSGSNYLRIAYYLQLTNLLPDALRSYPLPLTTTSLLDTLDVFDRGWITVIEGYDWNSTEETSERRGEGLSLTDRVRLRSIIEECKSSLRELIQGPGFISMKVDPFKLTRLADPTLSDPVLHEDIEETGAQEEEEEEEEEEEDMEEVSIQVQSFIPDSHNLDLLDTFEIRLPPAAMISPPKDEVKMAAKEEREPEWSDQPNLARAADQVDENSDDDEASGSATDAERIQVFVRTRRALGLD